MRKPIELKYSDLIGGGAAPGGQLAAGAAPGAAPGADQPAPGAETGGEFMGSVQSMMDQANSLITNFKDLLSMLRGAGLGSPGGRNQAPAIYQPQPTMEQQLHRIVNVCYTAYGDIAIQDLIQGLLTQYGKTRLSQILKALEGG
jgi:hypothetical protein